MSALYSIILLLGNSHDDSERYVCAGYDNGDLKMFDLRTMSVRWEKNLKNGVRGISFFLKVATNLMIDLWAGI